MRLRVSVMILMSLWFPALVEAAGRRVDSAAAQRNLRANRPTARLISQSGRLSRVRGPALARGATAADAAEAFRREHSALFGVSSDELVPGRPDDGAIQAIPVMYDPQTGRYRFTLYHYYQVRDGVKVQGAELRVLVRNADGFPVEFASSSLRDLGEFSVPQQRKAAPPAEKIAPSMHILTAPESIIYAGDDDNPIPPRVAITFTAERGTRGTPEYELWRYIADAETGEVLSRVSLIHRLDVIGTVTGTITEDLRASACAGTISVPLPYLRVTIGDTEAFANAAGHFVIPNAGNSPVTVTSNIRGRYFRIINEAVSLDAKSVVTTPPGPVHFVYATDTEYRRAERDAYYHANAVRDFVLSVHPDFPSIPEQSNFRINVNLSANACNAFYYGDEILLFRSYGGCPNSAIASVVYHEYGHHLIFKAGNYEQGAYGEGMSDALAVLVTGTPGVLDLGGCGHVLRSANNTMQFPCSGADMHDCGRVLSGCVWDTWQELRGSHPAEADQIIRSLTINSILLHTGGSITPSITEDFLALDDDDGDPLNGTPHEEAILVGFGRHNMQPWETLPLGDSIEGAKAVCPGEAVTGSFGDQTRDAEVSCDAANSNGGDIWWTYTPVADGVLTVDTCGGDNVRSVVSIHTYPIDQPGSELACDAGGCCANCGGIASTSVTAGHTYFIRAGNMYTGDVGAYELHVSGPACAAPLQFAFPSGLPTVMPPNAVLRFPVQITSTTGIQSVVPGTEAVYYRYDRAPFRKAPLIDQGGGLYFAELPPRRAEDTKVEFFISAQVDQGAHVTFPAGGADAPLTVCVDVTTTPIFETDFETDAGFTVSSTASDGQWDRGVPRNCGRGDPPTDFDGSGQCWLTDNGNCLSDVDGGETVLTSPPLNISGAANPFVTYAYWFSTNASGDYWRVEVRQGAGPWILVHEQTTSTTWRRYGFRVADYVTLGGEIQVRFTAGDGLLNTVVEAALDAFQVFDAACVEPPCPGDLDHDGDVDAQDFDAFAGCASGPTIAVSPGCAAADLDGDNDVDMDDFGILQRCLEN